MNTYIDQYCERLAPGFLAEPLNLLTNLAFIVAALCVYLLARRNAVLTPAVLSLVLLIALTGIGSALFHAFANAWSVWADIIPIILFQVVFILAFSRRVLRLGVSVSAIIVALFFVLSWLFSLVPQVLNNSLSYAPSLLVLAGFGVMQYRSRGRERSTLLYAAALFLCSLVFRTIDIAACDALQTGTHFIWHLINGVVLYLVMRALVVNLERAG